MPKKPKEILLYHNIDSWSSTDTIVKMAEFEDDEDMTFRICSDGGDPDYGFGIIAKFAEHKGRKLVKVDGKAHSMAFFFLAYADDSETLEMSEHVFHRASYPEWYETSDRFTPERRAFLERTNSYLKKALEAKVDVAKLESLKAMKGLKVKDVFSMDNRIDIFLTAQDLKAIGLVDRIVKITPQKAAEVNSQLQAFGKAALFSDEIIKQASLEVTTQNSTTENLKPKTMTKEDLKTQFPTVYAQIFKEGVDAGIEAEKDRVEACMTFIDVDPKGVKAAIESGKPLSQKQMADFSYKTMTKAAKADLSDDSAAAVTTTEASTEEPKTDDEKAIEEFKAAVYKSAGIDKSKKA